MRITIIGAGIAGLTTAIALKKAGFNPTICEASNHVKPAGAGLGLAPNAIKAFQKIGIADRIISLGRQLPYFKILTKKGKLITKNDSSVIAQNYGIDNFTIHRADLHQALLEELEGINIQTGKKAVDLHKAGKKIHIRFTDRSTYDTDYLIIADGIYSTLREKLIPKTKPRYAGYTCWRGVLTPESLDISGASETWGTEGRFGLVPLPNAQLYWFACINAKENDPLYQHFGTADLAEHFRDYHKPIPWVIQQTKNNNIIRNDIYDLKPLRQFAFDNILLLGDAGHGTTPNMGQGACQAIEDAAVLSGAIENSSSLENAFQVFEQKRLKRTTYIINQSRKIGVIAQISNPVLAGIRNFALRSAPPWVQNKQFDKLYRVDF